MKRIKHLRRFVLPISLVCCTTISLWTTTFSYKARADTSCNALLSDLSSWLIFNYPGVISIKQMTNYQANNQWFGGYTEATLTRSANGHLVGSGNRLLSSRSFNPSTTPGSFGYSQPFDIHQPDPISYDIDPVAAKITFNGQYGPYNMTCLGDKFAIVNGFDSIETFTFVKSPRVIPR